MSDLDRYKGKLNEEYELIMRAWPFEKELRQTLSDVIIQYVKSAQNTISVLELGSGSGESTAYILNALKSQGLLSNIKYVSVDNDSSVIEKQKNLLKGYSDMLSIHAEEALHYLKRIPDNNFNIVTSSWFLHNFKQPRRKEILKQIFRILKPNGLFATMDKYVPDDSVEADILFDEQIERFKIYEREGHPELREAMTAHEIEDRSPDMIMIVSDSIKMMEGIGFKDSHEVKRYLRDVIFVAKK